MRAHPQHIVVDLDPYIVQLLPMVYIQRQARLVVTSTYTRRTYARMVMLQDDMLQFHEVTT